MNKDWWKWGNSRAYEHVNNYPKLRQICIDRFGMNPKEDFHPPQNFNIQPISDSDQDFILNAFQAISQNQIIFSDEIRLASALGKSYYDVIRIFKNDQLEVPDVVLRPNNHEEVQTIISAAEQHNITIVPIGGR